MSAALPGSGQHGWQLWEKSAFYPSFGTFPEPWGLWTHKPERPGVTGSYGTRIVTSGARRWAELWLELTIMAGGVKQERFLGALMGMAIGDALGMPVAGWNAERIRERYGAIDGYFPRVFADGGGIKAGEFTD